jgi:hypothetical protein
MPPRVVSAIAVEQRRIADPCRALVHGCVVVAPVAVSKSLTCSKMSSLDLIQLLIPFDLVR